MKEAGTPACVRSLPWIRFLLLLLGWPDEVDRQEGRSSEYIRNNRDRRRC